MSAPSAQSVVERWFACHAEGDLDGARALFSTDGTTRVGPVTLIGFDALMAWYFGRREREGAGFDYEVVEILGGSAHVVAILRMRRDGSPAWRQVAVYEVAGGVITTVTLYEDAPDDRGTPA